MGNNCCNTVPNGQPEIQGMSATELKPANIPKGNYRVSEQAFKTESILTYLNELEGKKTLASLNSMISDKQRRFLQNTPFSDFKQINILYNRLRKEKSTKIELTPKIIQKLTEKEFGVLNDTRERGLKAKQDIKNGNIAVVLYLSWDLMRAPHDHNVGTHPRFIESEFPTKLEKINELSSQLISNRVRELLEKYSFPPNRVFLVGDYLQDENLDQIQKIRLNNILPFEEFVCMDSNGEFILSQSTSFPITYNTGIGGLLESYRLMHSKMQNDNVVGVRFMDANLNIPESRFLNDIYNFNSSKANCLLNTFKIKGVREKYPIIYRKATSLITIEQGDKEMVEFVSKFLIGDETPYSHFLSEDMIVRVESLGRLLKKSSSSAASSNECTLKVYKEFSSSSLDAEPLRLDFISRTRSIFWSDQGPLHLQEVPQPEFEISLQSLFGEEEEDSEENYILLNKERKLDFDDRLYVQFSSHQEISEYSLGDLSIQSENKAFNDGLDMSGVSAINLLDIGGD